MTNCDKYKLKAIIGLSLFLIIYFLGKYFKGLGNTQSGLVEFMVLSGATVIFILSLFLGLPYMKCLMEISSKYRKK